MSFDVQNVSVFVDVSDESLCLQEVLDIARLLLVELGQHNDCEIEEKKSKLEQLKTVLEM